MARGRSAAVVSRIGLPLSQVSASASRARLSSMRWAMAFRITPRWVGLAAPQASLAAWAASSARSTSRASERATSHRAWPFTGEVFSNQRPDAGSTHAPPM